MKTYTIIPADYLDGYKIQDCIQTSLDTIRYSVDLSEVVLKWNSSQPDPDWTDGYLVYDHASILMEMGSVEWDDGYV
jgi:hypothetical protein